MSNSRAGLLGMICSLYVAKDTNGFYRVSETWGKSEATNWNVDYTRATNNIRTLVKSLNKAHAKTYY